MSVTFEGYERRIDKINKVLAQYGIKDLEDARAICLEKGVDCEAIVKGVQPICFENAVWAYTVGCAIAIKKNCVNVQTPQRQSAKDFNPSASPALLQNNVKSVSDTAISPLCSLEKAPSASHSLQVTNPLLRQKAQSVSQEPQTKSERLP